MALGDPLAVEEWFKLMENKDDVSIAEHLLMNLQGRSHRFNAHNTMQVINLITAVRLSQLQKDMK